MSAPQPRKQPASAQSDYQIVRELMKEMGSPKGFDPIPPPQHKWQMAPGEDPIHRIWSWMCAHTIHWGHRSPYAVSNQGDELHLENIATDLGMDRANVRMWWRQGLRRGIWRNGTTSEGRRKLFLCGDVKPVEMPEEVAEAESEGKTEGEEKANEVCTYLLPPYILKQIKGLPKALQQKFWYEHNEDERLQKLAMAEVVSGVRSVFMQREDSRYQRYSVKKIREVHEAKKKAPEVEEARAGRLQALLPTLQGYVQTLLPLVQTPESPVYKPSTESVQRENTAFGNATAPRILIEKTLPEKTRGSASLLNLPASHERPAKQDCDGRSPVNEQYAPPAAKHAQPNVAGSQKASAQANAKPAAAQPREAMQLAKTLEVDLDAAKRILAGVRAADPSITLREVVGLAYAKLDQIRERIRAGKVNIPGHLIDSVPKAALGGLRDRVRDQALRAIEKDLEYARMVADDGEASKEDRARERANIQPLEAELEVLTAAIQRTKGAPS